MNVNVETMHTILILFSNCFFFLLFFCLVKYAIVGSVSIKVTGKLNKNASDTHTQTHNKITL